MSRLSRKPRVAKPWRWRSINSNTPIEITSATRPSILWKRKSSGCSGSTHHRISTSGCLAGMRTGWRSRPSFPDPEFVRVVGAGGGLSRVGDVRPRLSIYRMAVLRWRSQSTEVCFARGDFIPCAVSSVTRAIGSVPPGSGLLALPFSANLCDRVSTCSGRARGQSRSRHGDRRMSI
jgi:hypothetical protein